MRYSVACHLYPLLFFFILFYSFPFAEILNSFCQPINPDVDCGAGLRYDLSELHHLFAEIGTDFTPTGLNDWHTYLFVKIGYTYSIKL